MTRETKIGLVVAGSFLCLVCVVVASKWRRGDEASKEPEQQEIKVAAANPKPAGSIPDAKKKDEAAKPAATPAPAPAGDGKNAALPPLTIPPPSGAITFPGGPSDNTPLSLPPKLDAAPKLDPAPKLEPAPAFPTPATVKKDDLVPPPVVGAFPSLPIKKPDDPIPPPIVLAQDKDKLPAAPTFPPDKKDTVTFPPPMPLAPLDDKKTDAMKPGVGAIAIPPPAVTPPIVDSKPPTAKPDVAPKPLTDKNAPPMFPPAGADALPKLPPLGTPAAPDKDLKPPPTIVFPKDDPKPAIVPSDPVVPPGPIPKIGAKDLPSTPAITPVIPGVKPMPVVRDVSADTHVCQAADTSFAILAMQFYGSEKYAEALQMYNRDHAKLLPNGGALLTSPPTLIAGQRVLRPPVGVLESDYRLLIRPASAAPSPPIGGGSVNLARPMPLTPTAVPTTPTPGPTRSYRVQNPAGESILDIAERQLGNRGQWIEIFRINQSNPAVQPPRLIPAGTELKLP